MKSKAKRAVSVATMASLLITSSAISANVKAAGVTPPESPRLWGADRYETAVKVSQTGWTSGSDYAVIASGEGYADALCAAPLAKANNAPILLTEKGALNQNTLNELKRLNVKHVYIVGGQGVVSKTVEDKIKSEVTSDIQRLWGQDRYETSVKVAEKLGNPSKIVLASGAGYADALSAAPVAAIEGMPILLTESKTLSTATANYIKANSGITKTFVIGGYASVSDAAMNSAPNPQRLGGADRFETNSVVLDAFASDFNFKNAYVALGEGPSGNEFADALAGSAIAAKNGAPVIITSKVLNSKTQTFAKTHLFPSSTITVLGGTANVPDGVISNIKITASFLEEAGKTYSDVINSSADVTADNVTVKGNVKGDLYLNGNNASVSNVTVDGTVYINPGDKGVSNLDTVTAKNIVVLSGAQDSIHLKNVKADKLSVVSRDNVRITSEGTTAIASTIVSSKAILEATAGSFGDVNVPQTALDKTIEFRGNFDKPVTVEGQATLKTAAGAQLAALVVPEKALSASVALQGNGTIKNIQVKNATAQLSIDKNISVTGKIEAVNKDSIKSENSSIIGKVEQKPSGSMSDISNGGSTNTSGGGGGSSSGGSNNGGTTYTDLTQLVSDTYGKKMQDYLTAHPTLDKNLYVTTGSTIEFKITNSQWTSIEGMFATAKSEAKNDPNKFYSRVTMLQDLLDMPFVAKTDIGGKTIAGYLEAIYPSYFFGTEGNRRLEAGLIGQHLQSGQLDYTTFITNLKNKIKEGGGNGPTLAFKLSEDKNLVIDKIVKDNSTVYDKAASKADNVKFLDKNNIDDLTGNYTIYSGNYTIKIKITK
ncbi:MAG: cell wall-binding repeat-containing protein [Clostridiaceae bacterium]|nr:cell wall-binding repeat-containing protein [Clostridiaceae bacterium]